MMNQRTALLVGATGLVGGHCLQMLLEAEAYEKVVIILRRPFPLTHPKLEHRIVNFDKLDQFAQDIGADDIYCCLGTTINVAGSEDAFRRVDYTYPIQVAAIGAKNGAQQFLVVSALGADHKSKIFYNRVKGELEEAVSKIPFEAVHIFRPSLLVGKRSDSRIGERIGNAVMRPLSVFMGGPLKKYRPIEARAVAHAMILSAASNQTGIHIYESDQIQAIHDAAS
jgi:uncharacterized protein YbjT (DUF2867 family)